MEGSFHGVAGSLHSPALGTGIGVCVICLCRKGLGEGGGSVLCRRCVHMDIRVVEERGLGVEEVFLPVFVRALGRGPSVPGQPACPGLQIVKGLGFVTEASGTFPSAWLSAERSPESPLVAVVGSSVTFLGPLRGVGKLIRLSTWPRKGVKTGTCSLLPLSPGSTQHPEPITEKGHQEHRAHQLPPGRTKLSHPRCPSPKQVSLSHTQESSRLHCKPQKPGPLCPHDPCIKGGPDIYRKGSLHPG